VGVQPVSGQALWWSDNAIGSVTSLTRIIDLREVSHATLKYHVWWQTGDFPGFLHVLASVDEGHTWESLEGRRMVRRSPYNEAPGAHYAGNSGGRWLDDFIDLTGYTGQTVLLRFEYITNNAIAGPGFALDNIRIDEIGWLDDVETQDRDWIVDGFIRTGQMVAQNWIVQVVTNDSPPAITRFKLEAESQTLEFDLPETGGTLLIGAFAPISTTAATYTLQLNRLN
jgi:immune inhibitor A